MRIIILLMLFSINLLADSEFYSKEILFDAIRRPTLIRLKIDSELYQKMISDNIRIYSEKDEIQNHYIEHYRPNLLSTNEYDSLTIPIFSKNAKNGYTDYIFKSNGTPVKKIVLDIKEREYDLLAEIYVANRVDEWRLVREESLKRFEHSEIKDIEIPFNYSSNYIKIRVKNSSRKPLTIDNIKIKTAPNYLYFMAQPNERYSVYFTHKEVKQEDSEIATLVYNNHPFIEGKFAKLQKHIVPKAKEKKKKIETKDKTFVAVVIVAVIVLLYITVGLIKGKD